MSAAKIKGTPYEELVRRLIASGWTSTSISLYMLSRFGYELHDSTIRVYRLKHQEEIQQEFPELAAQAEQKVFAERALNGDVTVDVVGKLQEMIRLQEARIVIDVTHEESMNKLFGTTRSELKLLADLLQQYHETLQDWGIVPRAGQELTVRFEDEPRETEILMLEDVVDGDEDQEAVNRFARLIASASRGLPSAG